MSIADDIKSRLNKAFAPQSLEVKDQSHLHAGHMGSREAGETHFRVAIVAAAFSGCARVQRHRMVTEALQDLMDNPIHALALSIKTPEEAAR